MTERNINLGLNAEQFLFLNFRTPKDGLPLEEREVYELGQREYMLKMRLAELQRQQDEQNMWQKQAY